MRNLNMTNKSYELPELGYSYDALEPGYSAELLELHHGKHHQAYVDGANQNRHDLAEARSSGNFEALRQLQNDLAFNLSGHVMHSLFWRNLAPGDDTGPGENLTEQIKRDFGDMEILREQFQSAGGTIQGSGWAALSWEPLSQYLLVEQIHDHQDNRSGNTSPLLVMDMWEHAFYLQYRNEKKRWIKVFWSLVNWKDISRRLAAQQAEAG